MTYNNKVFLTCSYFEIILCEQIIEMTCQLPVWSWNQWVGRRGPAQSGHLDMNEITSSALLCGRTPWGKTNAPTTTVEQLQLVMNPIVGLFSRRLLNTTQQTEDVSALRTGRRRQVCLVCASAPPCFISPSLFPQSPRRWCARSPQAVPAGRTAPAQSGRSWTSSGWTAAASRSEHEPIQPHWRRVTGRQRPFQFT